MGNKYSKPHHRLPVQSALIRDSSRPNTGSPMDANKSHGQLPKIKFRILIIGRADSGKTSILQRVCDTTDSPVFFRENEEVQLDPSTDRGEHGIEDELVFSNHDNYIFHDSCGIEAGSNEELTIVQEFIRQRSGQSRLQDRLHAIWFCVPMDNQRPELDLKYFKDICPDRNVPVIAVFTKYDQFLRNVKMHLEDCGNTENVSDAAERQFKEHYLRHLDDGVRFVRLERMHKPETRCDALLEKTAEVLNEDVGALILSAVQSGLEPSINVGNTRALAGTLLIREQPNKTPDTFLRMALTGTSILLIDDIDFDMPN
ncbi:hypothetical protein H4582DRAFT_2151569 [Lactarius indigo]|nr:hypothetical protein H4582DRAFT_2151569 [Lactarius indigo]